MKASKISVTLSLLFFSACTGSIRISGISTIKNESDWTQLGGAPDHSRNANIQVEPPLTLLWRTDIGHSPTGVLTASSGNIFVATMGGKIHAIDHETGASTGFLDLDKSIGKGIAIDGVNGYFGRISGNKTLYGYELRNGAYIWQRKIGPVESIPLISSGLLYVTTAMGYLYCLDLETGTEKWKFKAGKPYHSTPARWKGLIISANDSGNVYGNSASNGSLKWKFQTGAPVFVTPIVSGDNIYIGNIGGSFYSIDAKTGVVNWKHEGTGSYYSTPSINDSSVFSISGDGTLKSLSVDNGNVKWKIDLHAPISEGILLSGKYIYIGSMDHNLYAVSSETGNILWSKKLDGRVRTSPLEYKGRIYIGTESKYLYAFSQTDE